MAKRFNWTWALAAAFVPAVLILKHWAPDLLHKAVPDSVAAARQDAIKDTVADVMKSDETKRIIANQVARSMRIEPTTQQIQSDRNRLLVGTWSDADGNIDEYRADQTFSTSIAASDSTTVGDGPNQGAVSYSYKAKCRGAWEINGDALDIRIESAEVHIKIEKFDVPQLTANKSPEEITKSTDDFRQHVEAGISAKLVGVQRKLPILELSPTAFSFKNGEKTYAMKRVDSGKVVHE